jgi:hypothetical protein
MTDRVGAPERLACADASLFVRRDDLRGLNRLLPMPWATVLVPGGRIREPSLCYGSLKATTSTRSMAGGAVNRSSP